MSRMRRTQLLSIVRSLLPPDTSWPDNQSDIRLEGGKTVVMLVSRVPDPRQAVKLIDSVCPHTVNLWARDSCGRHVIMDACYHGVHPSVLLCLVRWARRFRLKTIVPMSMQDINGFDAVELAIQGGHGELASCLLEKREPASHDHLLCIHCPLKVLELAIESRNEQCVRAILANKRVVDHLQSGKTERLNLITRWTQHQTPMKRLYSIFTCVGTAVRCGMTDIVRVIYTLNPEETHQAAWYAVHKLRSQTSSGQLEVSPEVQRMARSYLVDKFWPQLGDIVLLRHWELLARHELTCSVWGRIRRWLQDGHRPPVDNSPERSLLTYSKLSTTLRDERGEEGDVLGRVLKAKGQYL